MKDFLLRLKEDAEAEAEKLKADFIKAKDAAKEAVDEIHDEQEDSLNQWHSIYAWADGNIKSYPYNESDASHKDQAMKTLAVMNIDDNELKAPCTGVVGPIYEDENAIAFIIDPELIIALRVCKKGVNFEKEADVLVKPGQKVEKGQVLVSFGKHIQAKSKMLLLSPKEMDQFKEMDIKPAQPAGKADPEKPILDK